MMMRLMLVLGLSTWALSFAQKPKPAEQKPMPAEQKPAQNVGGVRVLPKTTFGVDVQTDKATLVLNLP